MPATSTELMQLRLLHLSSPCLPVGAYAFSQGLEAAIELGWLKNAEEIEHWLRLQLQHGLACVDLPILLRLDEAFRAKDLDAAQEWNNTLLACRETMELRLGDTATGESLARLLPELGIEVPARLRPHTFLALFTFAATEWQLPAGTTSLGYAWTWLENQVIAATKLLPLGQTQAQKLLHALQADIPATIAEARSVEDWRIGSSLPGLALASIHHETQYTRLFRS